MDLNQSIKKQQEEWNSTKPAWMNQIANDVAASRSQPSGYITKQQVIEAGKKRSQERDTGSYKWINQNPQENRIAVTSAIQTLNAKPKDKPWTVDMPPTTAGQLYTSIYNSSKTNPAGAQKNMESFGRLLMTPGTFVYNAYSKPSNSAVQDLQNYGIDTSLLTNDWFANNPDWQNGLIYNGTTNTPTKPGKKATKENWLSYYLYQYHEAIQNTNQAKMEWHALQEEATYWAKREDLNLSDEEIMDKYIDWDKYKTLDKMDSTAKAGKPMELNEAVGYSRENLLGVMWAARNGGGTGNSWEDLANYYLGNGNQWQANEEIAKKLDVNSDDYAPYSVSMTLNKMGAYFGMPYFPKGWVEENAWRLGSSDETEVENFRTVAEAEEKTVSAETELESLKAELDKYMRSERNPAEVEKFMQGLFDKGKYPTLRDMDQTIRKYSKRGDLVGLTRPVDFSWDGMLGYINDELEKKKNTPDGDKILEPFWQNPHNLNPTYKTKIGKPTTRIGGSGEGVIGSRQQASAAPAAEQPAATAPSTGTTQPVTVTPPAWDSIGQFGAGNIDLYNRPEFIQTDGSVSTVNSICFTDDDGKVVLIPTIVDGKQVSDDEAYDHYVSSGEYLGKFDSVDAAVGYSQKLHKQQERLYGGPRTKYDVREEAMDLLEEIDPEAMPELQMTVDPTGGSGFMGLGTGDPARDSLAMKFARYTEQADKWAEAAYDAVYGEGAYATDMELASGPAGVPGFEPEREKTGEQRLEDEKNSTAARTAATLQDEMTESEKGFFGSGIGVQNDRIREGTLVGPLNPEVWQDEEFASKMMYKFADNREKKYRKGAFDSLYFRTTFEKTQEELDQLDKQIAEIEAESDTLYASMKNLGDEVYVQYPGTSVNIGLVYNEETGEYEGEINWDSPEVYNGIMAFTENMEEVEAYVAEAAKRATEERNRILDAKSRLGDLSVDEEGKDNTETLDNVSRKLSALQAKREAKMKYYSENLDAYNQAMDDIHLGENARVNSATRMYDLSGVDSFALSHQTDNIIRYVSAFTDYQGRTPAAVPLHSQVIDSMTDRFNNPELTLSDEMVMDIHTKVDELNEEIADVRSVLDSYEDIPENYREWMEQYIEDLAYQKRQYKYILEYSSPSLQSDIEEGKDRMAYGMEHGFDDEFAKGHGFIADTLALMEPYEKDIFFALYGKYGYEEAWNYYHDMEESLQIRFGEETQKYASWLAEKGAGGRALALLNSIGIAGVDVVASAMNIGKVMFTGEGSGWLSGITNISKQMMGAINEELEKTYGKDTVQTKVLKAFYSMANNRGRSLMVGDTFGGIFPSGANEAIHAIPIALVAGADSLMQAIEDGAEPWQAWTIFGVTVFAESVTEAIEFKNIKGSLEMGKISGKEAFKEFIRGYIPEAMGEVVGESMNDILEDAADYWVMGGESEYRKNVDRYIELGYFPDEAEEMAFRDEVGKVMYTATISFFSHGLDLGSVAYGAVSSYSYYNQQVQQLRRNGDAKTTVRDLRNRDAAAIRFVGDIKQQAEDAELKRDLRSFDFSQMGTMYQQNGPSVALPSAEAGTAVAAQPSVQTEAQTEQTVQAEQAVSPADTEAVPSQEIPQGPSPAEQRAAVMEAIGQTRGDYEAQMAAASTETLVRLLGGDQDAAIDIIRSTLEAAGSDASASVVRRAMLYAGLSEHSKARRAITSDVFRQATPEERARMLMETASGDRADTKNAKAWREVIDAVQTFNDTEAVRLRAEEERAAREAETAARQAQAENGTVYETEQAEKPTTYDLAIAAMANADNSDQNAVHATVAAVLGVNESDGSRASAAANALLGMLGDKTTDTISVLMGGGRKADVNINTLKVGLQYAALADGACRQVMNSDEFKNASPEDQARMLGNAVINDARNNDVQAQVEAGVHDYRVKVEEQRLMSEGAGQEAVDAENAANNTRRKTQEAEDLLGERQADVEAKGEAVKAAGEQAAADPSDENTRAAAQATDELNRAMESENQYEQHLENQQAEQRKADEAADQAKKTAMNNVRQQAEANVAQVEAQEAQARQEAEERARIAQEEAEKARIEEDKQTGKFQEDWEDSIIESILDDEGLEDGTERDERREALKEQRDKIKLSKIDLGGSVTTTEGALAVAAFGRKLGVQIKLVDMAEGVRGSYDNGVIYLNKAMVKSGNMAVGQALVEAALHEITHSMEDTGAYQDYRDIVLEKMFNIRGAKNAKTGDLYNANGEFRAAIDALIKERSEAGDKLGGKDLNPEHDREIKIARAEKELIADFARENLAEKDVIQRFMDAGLSGTMRNTLHNINQALKNFFHRQDTKKIEQWNATHPDEQIDIAKYYKDAEYLRRAERAYQRAMNQVAKASTHPEGGQLSIAQVAQAAGMRFDADKMVLYNKNGDEINGVSTKIKISDMVETPVGFLIRTGLNMMDGENSELVGKEDGYIDPTSSAGKALDMMTGLMNMIARYRDSDLVWEIGASTLSSTFSALKGNSDTQYKTTVDFGTICAKTQAIVDVMSRVMMDKIDPETGMLKEGMKAGLTRKDIMTVYNATHNANLSVPCPVCYVFSRWMGVPSLLGQMSQFQKDYVVTKKDENGKTLYDKKGNAVIDWAATQAKVDDYLYNKETGMLVRYKDKDAVNDRKTSLNNKLKAMDDKRAELEVKARETKNEEEKAKIQEQIDAVLSDMVKVEDELAEVRAYNWIDQALCQGDGKFKVDQKNFRLTPDAVIFDMNRTGEFAEYSKNWSFRTTRGAGMGKAIMPYSGETIGDILKGGDKGKRQSAKSNPWLNYIEGGKNSAAIRQRNDARKRARQQNLLGGQRMQSTSDFRPEWGLDYIMSFLELQAAGSNVQMYTKVAEAVDFFASVGADVNLSIMGQGTGWHEATAEELSKMSDEEKAIRVVKLKDKQYIMDFSDITGMKYWSADPDERSATSLKNKYNNVQMILVGMNDTHIRLALANDNIDFVIPWHSSGNSKEILSGLISSVGEKLDRSVDYTTTQSDMRKGETKTYYDEDGNKVKYSAPGKQTEDEKKIWDLRMRILTGKANETEAKGGLTAEERKFVYDDEWLGPLYERFYVKGKDDACYGVKLSSKQANQIFPYEYWDTSLTKDKADENGERFVKYCERMGIIPRFSQFKDDPGYWKLLIDRPMYNLDGTYHKQQTIDVTKARIGELDESGKLDKSTSDLPTQARAAYAPKDPRSPMYKEYKGREEKAVQASEEALGIPHTPEQENAIIDAENLKGDDPYDPGMDAQMSVLGGQTDADRLIRSEPRNSAYLDAVDRGDMDVAQKMVDDAAKEAGYNLAVFHGTGEYFNTFERGAEGIHLGNMEQASQVADQRYETRSERTQYRWGDIRDSVGDMNTEQRESLLNQAYIMQDYFYDGNDVDPFDGDISDTAAVTAYVEGIMGRYAKSDEVSPDDVKIRFRTFDRKTGSHVMNLYAKMNNPFTFNGDIGQWTPDRIASTLMSLSEGQNEISDYYTTIDLSGSSEIQLSDEQKAVLERIAKFEISGDEAWDALSDTLGEIGYDGIKYLNTFEGDKNSYSYLALKQSDVKSADPVTYDDNDQPIPITERFNMGSTDTRYSTGGKKTDADIVLSAVNASINKSQSLSDQDIDRIAKSAEDALTSDFAKKYDAWDKTETGKLFDLGKPSDALIKFGVPDVVMRISGEKLNKIVKEHHGMNDTVIKQIPSIIKDPIIIMKSKTVEGRITAFGEIMDDDGFPVIAAFSTDVRHDQAENVDFTILNSAYGKNFLLQKFLNNSDLTIVDKKRADTWAGSLRLELPSTSALIGSSDMSIAQDESESNSVITEKSGMVIYNKTAYLKEDTINQWLKDFAASNPDYAQAYIAYINPDVFLDLTTTRMDSRIRIMDETGPLDENELQEISPRQPMFLRIDGKTGEIYGHEGRHRAVAMSRAGIEQIPVLLFDMGSKYSKKYQDSMLIRGQSFRDGVKNRNKTTLHNVIPLSNGYRDTVIQNFSVNEEVQMEAQQNDQRILQYSTGGNETDADRMTRSKQGYSVAAAAYSSSELENMRTIPEELQGDYTLDEINDIRYHRFELRDDLNWLPGNENVLDNENDLNQTLVNAGVVAQEDVDAYNALRVDQGQRQFGYKTVQDVEGVSQQVKDYLKTHSIYNKDTNDAQINRAVKWVMGKSTKADSTGFWGALDEIESNSFNPLTADGQAKMYVTMSLAANMNNTDVQKRIANAINKQGTTIGQALQARKLYRLMTPDGRVAVMQKEVDNVNAELRKAGKEGNIQLSEWIQMAAASAQTEEEFAKAQQALWEELGEQMPVTWFERLQAWRMLSMLGNPRTHLRNIVGNLGFMPMVSVKNKIGATLENMFLDEGQKTKAIVADKGAMEWAEKDAEHMQGVLTGEAKYSDKTKIAQNKQPFGKSRVGKAFQALAKASGDALEAEDWFFLKKHYRNALAGWMTANKVTGDQLEMDDDLMDRARAYAIEEAQKATYRDANAFADFLGKADKLKGVRYLSTAVLPFKRTPLNILERGLEYSPLGLLKAASVDIVRLHEYNQWASGKKAEKADWAISPAQYIDKLASGLTGTLLAGVGAFLKKAGILSLGFKKDDPEDKFRKAEGQQEYAINFHIGDVNVSYTIDWLAPACMTLFVGAAVEEACENHGMDLKSVLNGLSTITEPIWNLSMLDSVNSLLETSMYEDANVATQILLKTAMNYANSFIPTFVGQFSKTIDTARRKAFVESGTDNSSVAYSLEQMQNKLPFSVWNIPYRDHRGNEDRKHWAARLLENFISPGYVTVKKDDPTLKELHRLYSDNEGTGVSGLNSLVPSDADKSFAVAGVNVRLTDKQYDQLDEERKEIAYGILDKLMQDPYYAQVDDEARIAMISDVWQYATQQAKYSQFPDFKRADWISRTEKNSKDPLTVIKKRSEEKMLSDQKTGWEESMVDAIRAGDRPAMNMAAGYLKGLGYEQKDIEKAIKAEFSKEYQQAYKNGDRNAMKGIEAMLKGMGFQFDYESWLKSTKKSEDEWLDEMK